MRAGFLATAAAIAVRQGADFGAFCAFTDWCFVHYTLDELLAHRSILALWFRWSESFTR
jgi:hypothetical protein